jgi:hypothetical protein
MTHLDPDLERLGQALRVSTAIDLAREEQAARPASTARAPRVAGVRGRWTGLRPRWLAGGTLGLAGVGAALVLILGASTATPPAFAVTRQPDGSVLVTVNVDQSTSWVGPADRKLAAIGIDEQILLSHENGAPPVNGLVNCTPLGGASTPSGPPVKVLFTRQGTPASSAGNTGAGNTRVSGCVYFTNPGEGDTANTGNG